MNKMYEYLKNHAYISYNKKSTYEFELSEERAKCIANKYDSLTDELLQENKQLKEKLDCDLQWAFKYEKQVDNWNKLKEYIKQEPTLYFYNDKLPFEVIIAKIINKMQELEQGSDSDEKNKN